MIKAFTPFFILFMLLALLSWELFYAKSHELPSALIGEDVPEFNLSTIFPDTAPFTKKTLMGKLVLLNVWSTTCEACKSEHDMLMKIQTEYHVPLYSFLYKDDAQNAVDWLEQHGNPYTMIGNDAKGDVAIDFGVYGTPEMFVIGPHGKIIYRHIGIIDQPTWDNVLYPLIKKYEAPYV